MMLKRTLLVSGIAAVIGLGASALALAHGPDAACSDQPCGWHQGWHMGPGMMGQGQMGPGYGMGPGMMGQGQMGPGSGMGPGMMGQGQMGPGSGMGPGMMGQGQMAPGHGMGPGMMGQGRMAPGDGMGPGMRQPLRQDLSAADVQHMMEHRLAWQDNPNIKLGKVEDKDDDTIVAEIVTQDGSLVQRLEVDRHTGSMRPAR